MHINQLRDTLADEYFDYLEANTIRFIDYDDAGHGFIIDRFAQTSDNDRARLLGYIDFADYIFQTLQRTGIEIPAWTQQWTREVLS